MCGKLIACFIIVAGCISIGLRYCYIQKKRVEQLCELYRMIAYICDEIKCNHRILSETFKSVSVRCSQPLSGWLLELAEGIDTDSGAGFENIWIKAIEKLVIKTCLDKRDTRELNAIGHAFSSSDVNSCINNICVENEHLKERIYTEEKELGNKSRIGIALSATIGILLVILLW